MKQIKQAVNNEQKQITKLNKQLQPLVELNANPVTNRKMDRKSVLKYYKLKQNEQLHDYLTAVMYPDIAVKDQLNARIPSLVGSPSVVYRSHQNLQLSTGATGAFLLRMLPATMLQQSDGDVKTTVFNNTCNGSGTVGVNNLIGGTNYLFPSYAQRYRPVGVLVKVSYNGSVLNQSGKLFGCYTFETAITVGGPTSAATDGNLDRYSSNFSLIRNGLWNQEVNITKDADGIEMIYVPLDPISASYAGAGDNFYTKAPYPTAASSLTNTGLDIVTPQFVIAGNNFPANANCISLDIYSVFEVIPDPTGAFMASNDTHKISGADSELVADYINKIPKIRSSNTNHNLRDLLTKGSEYFNAIFSAENVSTAINLFKNIATVF